MSAHEINEKYGIEEYKLSYRACIPFYVLLDRDLSGNEKTLYGIIEQMESSKGVVFYNNRSLAAIIGVSHESRMIGKMAKNLKDKGYIERTEKEFFIKGNKIKRFCWGIVKAVLVDEECLGGVPEIPPPPVSEIPPPPVSEIPPYNTHDLKAHNINVCGETVPSQPINFEDYKKAELNGLENASNETKKTNLENEALNDEKNRAIFEQRFAGRDVTIEEIFKGCQEYYSQKGGWIGSQRFKKWLNAENPENYAKKSSHQALAKNDRKKFMSDEDAALLADYKHWANTTKNITPLEQWMPNQEKRERAIFLYNQEQDFLKRKQG